MPLHQTLARVSSTNQSSPHQISPYWSSPHQCLDAGNETKVPQSISRFIQAITTDIDTDTAAMASCNFRALRFHGFPNQFLGLSYYVYYYFDDIGDWNANLGTEPDTDNVGQIISTSLDQVTSKIVSSLTKLTLDESDATINGTISNSAKLRPCKMAMLPVTALLLSVIFLVITILVSRRHKRLALWKSSVLPLLYHGLDEGVALPDGEDYAVVSGMEADAKSVEVRLEESERGRLMFR